MGHPLQAPLTLDDARVLRRQFVVDLLLSLGASSAADAASRSLTLQVMNAPCPHMNSPRPRMNSPRVRPARKSAMLEQRSAPG